MVEGSTRHDVFLSYDWRDHRPVEEIARALRDSLETYIQTLKEELESVGHYPK